MKLDEGNKCISFKSQEKKVKEKHLQKVYAF